MSAIKGDFIGFTFGGKHSTDLGINRVSNGSRYTETLLPEFSNKTVNVPGANRVDYLGMEFTQKSFPLDIAFDSVTEEQLREMRRLFGTNKPLPLVFDENPYKTYYAKAGGNPSFSYVCFDEEDIILKKVIEYSEEQEHPYSEPYIIETDYPFKDEELLVDFEFVDFNGEKIQQKTTINLLYNFFETYHISNVYNVMININTSNEKIEIIFSSQIYDEFYENWVTGPIYTKNFKIFFSKENKISKRIYKGEGKVDLVSFYPYAFCEPDFAINYDSTKQPDNYYEWIRASGLLEDPLEDNTGVYNPGDLETPFWLKINGSSLPEGKIKIGNNSLEWSAGAIDNSNLPEDAYIIVDGRNQLIEGYNDNGKTGRIYNHLITSGNWFNIPISENKTNIFSVEKPEGSELYYKILYI